MQILPLTLLIAAWFGVVPRPVLVDPLSLQPEEASVRIGTRPAGAPSSYGAAISFALLAKFECPGDAIAESIVVSIADTLARHTPAPGDDVLQASLVVPGDQIVPMDTGNFCVGATARSGDDLLLPAAATAHASLRCRGNDGTAVRFASVAMPLRLVCEPAENQDESAAVGR